MLISVFTKIKHLFIHIQKLLAQHWSSYTIVLIRGRLLVLVGSLVVVVGVIAVVVVDIAVGIVREL